MLRNRNNQFYKTVVSIWLTLSIASLVLAVATWFQLSNRLSHERKSAAIRMELNHVLKLLLDTETAHRGYVISGEETFLDPMNQAEALLPARFERLAELTSDEPQLLNRMMEMRAKAELSLSEQRKLVAIRRTDGFLAAKAAMTEGEAKRFMEEIRQNIADMYGVRTDLAREEQASGQLLRAALTSLIAGIVGIGTGLFAFWLAGLTVKHQARERELVEAKLEAERSSQEKTFFLANMSHEIRTPMNAILGFSELLEVELNEPKQRQYMHSIRTSANALLQLINDVLDISKIEAGAIELRPEPTDLREICSFVRSVFAERTTKKGIKLDIHLAEDLPRAILVDRLRLRQILINLVGNAVKFTENGGIDLRVSFEKQTDTSRVTLILDVQDTGVGIPKEMLDAVFKPFVQSGANQAMEEEGSGLGLAIVKRLTERMGGTITVASIVGQGSAFQLRFPDISVSARLPESESESTTSFADFNELNAATILVVDDNEMNRNLMAGMFSGTHHRLAFATNGREAVERTRSLRPDVVLLDIRMPEMDGREALSHIRKTSGLELLPVIAITASSSASQTSILREKFSGYLGKPFSRQELFNELAHFLPRKASEAAWQDRREPETNHDWTELVTHLQRMLKREWPQIEASLGVNELTDFASRLEALADRYKCEPLLNYARTLSQDARLYAVDSLETHCREFPRLVAEIERSTKLEVAEGKSS